MSPLDRRRALPWLFVCAPLLLACRKPAPDADLAPGGEGGVEPDLAAAFDYPEARRVDQVDDYHGTKVPDPYRWLEDVDSPETRAWIEAQNTLTFSYLGTIAARGPIRDRLTALWNYERFGTPKKVGSGYVFSRNDGLQNQSVLYYIPALHGQPRVLLDPNTLSADGTVALTDERFSPDGRLMAYGVAESGSDWEVWRVRDVATGKDLSDELRWIKFATCEWATDGKGLFYSRYDVPKGGKELEDLNYDQKVFVHRLGDEQGADTLVYERPDHRDWGFDALVTDDGRYLVIEVRLGTDPKKNIFFQDLKAKAKKGELPATVELLRGFEASYDFVDNDGPVFYFQTDRKASRGRIIAIDTRKPDEDNWTEIVAEQPETLREVDRIGGLFVATYLDRARARVRMFDDKGAPAGELALPGIGAVSGLEGKAKDTETFYTYESFAQPETVYRYDFATKTSTVFRAPKVAFDPNDFVTEQVTYESTDGTKVPMFLSRGKGVTKNGALPTYLYGYGGFDIPLTPRFSVANVVWMEMGGLLAQPNLRGGGEFGEQWHLDGTRLKKQNVFDDFIAAALWLTKEKWTNADKLSIGGRSNGGLLVGAVMSQRPDLFAAALPGVGVMDMLRFNKFTIGWAWESDYGSPQHASEFQALYKYSPVHNLEHGAEFPATLVYTADHDDRVVPAHSFKFAAALQYAHAGNEPVMIRIDTKAGHGKGKPVTKQIEEWADLWGFLVENLKMPMPKFAP